MSLSLRFLGVTFLEALDAAGGVHQFLLAREERMAFRANGNGHGRRRRNSLGDMTTGTGQFYGVKLWMSVFFHN